MKAVPVLVVLLLAGAACHSPLGPPRENQLAPWAIEERCRVEGNDYILVGTVAAPEQGRPTCSSIWLIPEELCWAEIVIPNNYGDTERQFVQ